MQGTLRRFHNDVTGHLLCPVDNNWSDADERWKIHEFHPKYLVTAQSLPAFLYAGGLFDPHNPDNGLFKGKILEKAFKAIFMFPSMKTVEPCAIAYVACQVRFALSSVGSWAIVDGVFNTHEFYEVIVEWFEEIKTEKNKNLVDNLLLWWNR
ncbi:hypothetical protein V8E55_006540 [Tylopilus felleus]